MNRDYPISKPRPPAAPFGNPQKGLLNSLLTGLLIGLLACILFAGCSAAEEAPATEAGTERVPARTPAAAPPIPAKLAFIPEGDADLGSDQDEKDFGYSIGGPGARRARWFDGETEREVELPDFWMDETPVTQAAYGEFVRDTRRPVPYISEEAYRAQRYLVHPYDSVVPYLWFSDRAPAGRGNHPVVLVTIEDGESFCKWRARRTGGQCRLPSEDEWEKAARGTDGQYFPWGDEWDAHRVNTVSRGPYGTTPVDRYPQGRSPYGLFDMAGNVFEWTATPGRRGRSVLKSCSWDDFGGICRAAARHARPGTTRHILIGFRCACDDPGTLR